MLQDKIDQFILINMGATIDFLNIDEDGNPITSEDQAPLINDQDEIEIYVIDSHRPVNLIKYGSQLVLDQLSFWPDFSPSQVEKVL